MVKKADLVDSTLPDDFTKSLTLLRCMSEIGDSGI